jgi:uncharacterized protein YjiS (DUF1127 family)
MSAQGVANTLNGLAKWPSEPRCGEAVALLAGRLCDDADADLAAALTAQGIANALNALSKWPNDARGRQAMSVLAGRLSQDAGLVQALTAQGMANALNALSKMTHVWVNAAAEKLNVKSGNEEQYQMLCSAAVNVLASHLSATPTLVADLTAQGMSNVLNACSKWAKQTSCKKACKMASVTIAKRLNQSPALTTAFSAQGMANALKSLREWPDQQDCRRALSVLVSASALVPAPVLALKPAPVAAAPTTDA